MICRLSRSKISKIGLFICLAFLATATICVIILGVNYDVVLKSTNNNKWQSLGPVLLAAIIYVLILFLIGLFAFWCKWNFLLTIVGIILIFFQFSTLLTLSCLFTFAIAIIALIGGSWGNLDTLVGCKSKYTGIIDTWKNVDVYLQQVDSALCSQDCPCTFKNPADYSTDPDVLIAYAKWEKTLRGGAKFFQNCTEAVQTNAYSNYASQVEEENFLVKNFQKFWIIVEERFFCSGWCETTYYNSKTLSQMTMYKYLFTGIDR